eukprot:gene580-380_t
MVLAARASVCFTGTKPALATVTLLWPGGATGAEDWQNPLCPWTKWRLCWDTPDSGVVAELLFRSSDGHERKLSGVLFGEVYLCSGQSNMQKPITTHPGAQAIMDVAMAYDIRYAVLPARRTDTSWGSVSDPGARQRVSAVCLEAVALALSQRPEPPGPVGLVCAAQDAAAAECFAEEGQVVHCFDQPGSPAHSGASCQTDFLSTHLCPAAGWPLRAVMWSAPCRCQAKYQGERNARDPTPGSLAQANEHPYRWQSPVRVLVVQLPSYWRKGSHADPSTGLVRLAQGDAVASTDGTSPLYGIAFPLLCIILLPSRLGYSAGPSATSAKLSCQSGQATLELVVMFEIFDAPSRDSSFMARASPFCLFDCCKAVISMATLDGVSHMSSSDMTFIQEAPGLPWSMRAAVTPAIAHALRSGTAVVSYGVDGVVNCVLSFGSLSAPVPPFALMGARCTKAAVATVFPLTAGILLLMPGTISPSRRSQGQMLQ